jgi:hypothetical protein
MKNIMKILSAAVLVMGMAMSAHATLYATGGNGNTLETIDPGTGLATNVGTFNPAAQIWCQAFLPDGTLWGIDTFGQLYRTDPATANVIAIGVPQLDSQVCASLAADSTGNLYMMQDTDNRLFSVDPVTGVPTLIAVVADASSPMPAGTSMYGLAFDSTGTLYAYFYNPGPPTLQRIFIMDPVTAVVTTAVDVTGGVGGIGSFTIDHVTGAAYMVDYIAGDFYTLDMVTGVATFVANTGVPAPFGLASTWPVAPVVVGSGGCALDVTAGFDPLLPVLALIALGFLYRRRSSI